MDKRLMKQLLEEKNLLLDSFAQQEMAHLKNKSIMIVDDSDDSVNIMKTFLKKQTNDLTIKSFADEIDAVKEIVKDPPDLLVLDIMLKSISGLKLGPLLNQLQIFEGPILFISSNSSFKKELSMIYGDNFHFMQKPLDKKLFAEQVVKILNSWS